MRIEIKTGRSIRENKDKERKERRRNLKRLQVEEC